METEKDQELSYKEKKAQQIKKRGLQRQEAKSGTAKKSITKWGITIIIIALSLWGFVVISQKSGPQGEDFSESFPSDGRQHIKVGSEHPPYSSNPPSSGSHYASTARAGFYDVDEHVPDEQIVHNLEHGDIWIAYKPDIAETDKELLREFAASKVIITPRTDNDLDVALVAWGHVDSFDLGSLEAEALESRISDFIARFINKGPERVQAPIGGHRR
ncbi:DUF3105 domain-containing protein [Patescibacteria group bacterium]|nr:DUF3105 domain-containing protein [Patescibacteria group bacterium]